MHVTPEQIFTMSRRDVLKALGLTAAAAFAPVSLAVGAENTPQSPVRFAPCATVTLAVGAENTTQPLVITPESVATTYNNFYEFGQGKNEPAANSKNFDTTGWTVRVEGLVKQPLSLSMPDMLDRFGQTEYIYRMRCVEGWSMVIPWQGFALRKLIEAAQPDARAQFVAFESAADKKQMPDVARGGFPYPYLEGLRLDEAMSPLTIMATGAYGKAMPAPNGAPIRLIVPWKYGFKSLKSVVKITLVEKQPRTTWDTYNPREYGFYSNVNPDVPHRRWSQSTERFIGPGGLRNVVRQPTLLFNGYDEVAPLYAGMDLKKNY